MLFVHLLGAIAWLGGMFFAYFCLRPAAAEVLKPPDRLPLWSATFARFLPFMAIAVVFILTSGLVMLVPIGFAAAPIGWYIMLSLGVAMAGIFAYVYVVLFPQLRSQCASSAWPEAGRVLNRIRQLVGVNLVFGLLVVLSAVSARSA